MILRCWGQKPPTMMPTDCFVLRTPTILPAIRISWCLRPTFMLISGRVSRSFYHQCASTRGFRPFDPDIINYSLFFLSSQPVCTEDILKISVPQAVLSSCFSSPVRYSGMPGFPALLPRSCRESSSGSVPAKH